MGEAADNARAFGYGVADQLTGGVSSAIAGYLDEDYECFIEDHSDAFGSGQVVATVAEVVIAVATVVVTAGAAAGAVVALAAAKIALKATVHAAVTVVRKEAIDAAQLTAVRGGSQQASAAARAVPQIKPGVSGGPTAGQPFSQSVRNASLDENRGQVCVYCHMETKSPQIDHAIPKVEGGAATLPNAQVTCAWCNGSKGPRPKPVNPPPGYVGEWPPLWWSP